MRGFLKVVAGLLMAITFIVGGVALFNMIHEFGESARLLQERVAWQTSHAATPVSGTPIGRALDAAYLNPLEAAEARADQEGWRSAAITGIGTLIFLVSAALWMLIDIAQVGSKLIDPQASASPAPAPQPSPALRSPE